MTRYTPLWEQAGSYAASIDRRLIAAMWPPAAVTGCAVTAQAGTMLVNIAPGAVAVPSQNSTGSTLCVSDAVEQVAIGAASGQNRIDLVICRPRGTDLDGGTNNDFIFDTVAGVPAASPAPPATPAGTVLLAQILVPTGSVAVTQPNITDSRPAVLNGAAEPATTSASVVSRTDTNGEVWVAKAGVNAGLWRKARDVLSAKWWRSAALTLGTAAAYSFDTMERDPYGLYATGPGVFTVPVAGLYAATHQVGATSTSTGAAIGARINKNASTLVAVAQSHTYINGQGLTALVAQTLALAAGDTLTPLGSSTSAVGALTAGPYWTYMTVQYLGTG